MADEWRIELDADDERAYAALATDSVWNGYSIGDLAPPRVISARTPPPARRRERPGGVAW